MSPDNTEIIFYQTDDGRTKIDMRMEKDVLLEARSDAVEMVRDDPGLSRPEHAKLRKQMLSRYGAVLNLGDVE